MMKNVTRGLPREEQSNIRGRNIKRKKNSREKSEKNLPHLKGHKGMLQEDHSVALRISSFCSIESESKRWPWKWQVKEKEGEEECKAESKEENRGAQKRHATSAAQCRHPDGNNELNDTNKGAGASDTPFQHLPLEKRCEIKFHSKEFLKSPIFTGKMLYSDIHWRLCV
jgi:hypothetical protein